MYCCASCRVETKANEVGGGAKRDRGATEVEGATRRCVRSRDYDDIDIGMKCMV